MYWWSCGSTSSKQPQAAVQAAAVQAVRACRSTSSCRSCFRRGAFWRCAGGCCASALSAHPHCFFWAVFCVNSLSFSVSTRLSCCVCVASCGRWVCVKRWADHLACVAACCCCLLLLLLLPPRAVGVLQQYITLTLYNQQMLTTGVQVATRLLGMIHDANLVRAGCVGVYGRCTSV